MYNVHGSYFFILVNFYFPIDFGFGNLYTNEFETKEKQKVPYNWNIKLTTIRNSLLLQQLDKLLRLGNF